MAVLASTRSMYTAQQRVEIAQISPGLYCRTHFFG